MHVYDSLITIRMVDREHSICKAILDKTYKKLIKICVKVKVGYHPYA